jgi:hypothetical protein
MDKRLDDVNNQFDFPSLPEIKHRVFCLSVLNLVAVPTELREDNGLLAGGLPRESGCLGWEIFVAWLV